MRRIPALMACAVTAGAMLLPSPAAAAPAEQEAIEALNDVRRSAGLAPLRKSESLSRSSGQYARKMLRHDFFGHGPSIDVAGGFRSAGETLAYHTGWSAQPRRTVSRWMNSPPHRAVLLSPGFRWVGMGLARGRLGGSVATTWVAHVGAR
ncbi:MAG TPA: CAP domain-containing protein [Thermoleophilaceae bacterium]|nr:CAP domain-containing protein [Thermoleophilaceae bacterium]